MIKGVEFIHALIIHDFTIKRLSEATGLFERDAPG